jgi:hypothetical protein
MKRKTDKHERPSQLQKQVNDRTFAQELLVKVKCKCRYERERDVQPSKYCVFTANTSVLTTDQVRKSNYFFFLSG